MEEYKTTIVIEITVLRTLHTDVVKCNDYLFIITEMQTSKNLQARMTNCSKLIGILSVCFNVLP